MGVRPRADAHEPLGPWLWAQHNEHRLPLPRLVYYGLFQITHDFRTGSLLQIGCCSATSLALMSLAAHLRGRAALDRRVLPGVAASTSGTGKTC